MEIFNLTLTQMLTMFIFILVGYLLRKAGILSESSQLTMSRLETYFFMPALNFYTWMTNCTAQTLKENAILILYGLVLILAAILLSYPLSRLFIRKADNAALDYQRCIYKYAMAFSNYGFLGNFIVLGVWGSEMFFKYSMFTLCLQFASCSWALFVLIPKGQGKQSMQVVLKRIFTPPLIALLAGMLVGLCDLKEYVPNFITTVLSDGSECMGPVAMLLAGVVIGGYGLKELLTYKKVYAAAFMRLIVIPACFVLILKLFGTSDEIVAFTLIAFAAPLGLNTIVYPAAYGGDVKTGASMTMISSTLSVITLPLMYLFFVVL